MPETPEGMEELLPVAPPEEVADKPADELRQELLAELTHEQEEDLSRAILADYRADLEDRHDWETSLARWEAQYHGLLPDKTFPWPGCSNFNVPLTALGVETLKPRLVETVLGEDPPITVRPTEWADEGRQERVEDFLNWQVQTEMDLAPLVRESAHRFLIPGLAVAKTRWKIDDRRLRAIRVFPTETPFNEVLRAVLGDEPLIGEPTQLGPMEWEVETRTHTNTKRMTRLKFVITETEQRVLVDREERRFEGPWIDLIAPEDLIVPVNGGSDVQRISHVMHRQWLTADELRRKVRLGRMDREAVEELLRGHRPTGEAQGQDSRQLHEIQAAAEHVETQGASDERATQYEILEDYRRWDLDEDGLDEELVTWVCPDLPDRVLGWDYLDNLYAHGRRPFRTKGYLPQPGRFYGISFPELVRGLQEEINTIHNQRVDAGTIQNTPGGFIRATSTTPPEHVRIRPGEFTPLDNPQQDVMIPQWNGSPVFGQNEESLLYQYFERLTGLTDLALGRQPNRVGATRTATGVASLLSEAGLRFKMAMRAFQEFWQDIFSDILALDQQYLPDGKEFRVTGKWPEQIKLTSRADIAGRFDVRVVATTESLNRQIMREDATVTLNTLMNPGFLQLGIVGMKGLDRALRRFLRAYGEDPDLYLEPMRDQIVRTPDQELTLFQNGDDAEPSMAEHIGEHVQKHQAHLADPVVQAVLGPAGLKRLQAHLAKTMQMAQMQMMAQQMAQKGGKGANPGGPVAGQQAANAQIGREAAMGPQPPSGFGNGPQMPGMVMGGAGR